LKDGETGLAGYLSVCSISITSEVDQTEAAAEQLLVAVGGHSSQGRGNSPGPKAASLQQPASLPSAVVRVLASLPSAVVRVPTSLVSWRPPRCCQRGRGLLGFEKK